MVTGGVRSADSHAYSHCRPDDLAGPVSGTRTFLSANAHDSLHRVVLQSAASRCVNGGAATYVKYRQHGGEAGRSLGNVVVNKGLEIFAMLGLATLAGCYLQGGVKLLMVAMFVCLLVGWSYRQVALAGDWPKFRLWVRRSPSVSEGGRYACRASECI